MATAEELENYNPTEAKEEISDLLTQIEGHDMWIREQFKSTETRLNAFSKAIKQSDRLRQMLQTQINDTPTQQQYQLILALKTDFLKAISQIQDELITSSTGQSLDDSKMKIQQLTHENEQLKYKIQQQNLTLQSNAQSINSLRQENERLQRLKDLLIQQQDAMNQRLSQQKGKDEKINALNMEIDELKQSFNIVQQEKQTLNNNFKLQIQSLNTSCKQLLDANKLLKQQQNNNVQMDDNKSKQYELLKGKYKQQIELTDTMQQNMDDISEKMKVNNEQLNSSNVEMGDKNEKLQAKCVELEHENDILTNQISMLEQENNNQIVKLESDKQKLQGQFTVLLQQKADLQQEKHGLNEDYNELNEKCGKLEQENRILTDTCSVLNDKRKNDNILADENKILTNNYNELNGKYEILEKDNKILKDKYNELNEKHDNLTHLNAETIERNLTEIAQINALKQTINTLKLQLENTDKNQVDSSVLQSKIDELSQQVNTKNKQIADQRMRGEEMQNQRATLQRKLQESQKTLLEYQTKCQELQSELSIAAAQADIQNVNNYPTRKAPPVNKNNASNNNYTLSTDDLLAFFNINSELKPIDEMISSIVLNWKYSSQVFMISGNNNNEIKENDIVNMIKKKQWKNNENILENVLLEINSMRENNTYQNESQQQFCALVLDLITQKIKLIKDLGKLYMNKGEEMSQIMYQSQKRISMLQNDLTKKNREMEMHIKVKEKMFDEIKAVQQRVENLTSEYQTVVQELDRVRQGRVDSIDSSFD